MEEASKTAFEGGVVSLTGSFGISEDTGTSAVDTFNSTNENDSGDISKVETVDYGTGVEMTIQDYSTVEPRPEGGKSWLLVFAVFMLLGCINVHVTLQKPTLTFFGQDKEPSPGNTQTTTPTSSCSTVSWICDKIPEVSRRTEIQTLLEEFKKGDNSVIANISEILHALNLSQEVESFLMQIQVEGGNPVAGKEAAPLNVSVVHVVDVTPVTDTYQALFSIFGVFSASLILLTNFRWVSVTGSVLTGVGCLGTAFCDNCNIHVVSFLYGALLGIGHNMILVSSIVGIITHFKIRRLLALLIPHIGERIGAIITSFLAHWLLPAVGLKTWKSYLLLQSGIALAMIVFSFLLTPINTGHGEYRCAGLKLMERTFGFNGLEIYKTIHLYTFALVFFCWYGGYSIIEEKLAKFQGLDLIPILSFGTLLLLLLLGAALIGTCVSCCLPRTMPLKAVLILVSALSGVASLFNLLTSQMISFVYALTYSAVLGLLKGVTDPVLQYAIPLVVGEEHVTIGTGVMTTGQGLGGLVMTTIADQIELSQGNIGGCFYLAGALHLLGSASSVVTVLLLYRASCVQVCVTPSPEHPGKQDTPSSGHPGKQDTPSPGHTGKQESVGTYTSTL